MPRDHLAAVLNTFMLLKWVPNELKESRTILIPKCLKAGKDVSKYRPISITPSAGRLYAKIISNRIYMCAKEEGRMPFGARQKALIPEDGCFENIHTLRSVLEHSRRKLQELNICNLDLAKAF